MAALCRTREFFSSGGVLLTGHGRPLSRMIAGLGLAAAVAVLPIPAGDGESWQPAEKMAEAVSLPLPEQADATETASTGGETGNVLSSAVGNTLSLLAHHARWVMNSVHVHQFGEYRVSQFVASEIVRAANDTGFPADTLMAIVEKESSFDVNARPRKGSALGLMQFIEQKWFEVVADYGSEFGLSGEAASIKSRPKGKYIEYYVEDPQEERRILDLRREPYLAAALGARNLIAARERIEARIDRAMADADLYLPHFLGTNGAGNLIEKSEERPGALARRVFPAAARYNASMFRGRSGKALTVRQFHESTRSVIEDRVGKYRDVEEMVEKTAYLPEKPAGDIGIADLFVSGVDAAMLNR